MSTGPEFAAFFAVPVGGQSLTARTLVGGAMMLIAMLIAMLVVELAPGRRIEAEVPRIAVGGLPEG